MLWFAGLRASSEMEEVSVCEHSPSSSSFSVIGVASTLTTFLPAGLGTFIGDLGFSTTTMGFSLIGAIFGACGMTTGAGSTFISFSSTSIGPCASFDTISSLFCGEKIGADEAGDTDETEVKEEGSLIRLMQLSIVFLRAKAEKFKTPLLVLEEPNVDELLEHVEMEELFNTGRGNGRDGAGGGGAGGGARGDGGGGASFPWPHSLTLLLLLLLL